MAGDYFLCGWRVRSQLPLPELVRWSGPEEGEPDVVIREGEVPERLDAPLTPGRYLMVDAEGAVLLHIVNQVRFLARGGNEIVVQLLSPEARESWRVFLLGAVLAYLCHQRKVFPLHAATLKVNGRTIAIAGHRGDGKSTLAFALTQRGHTVLSDDLTVVGGGPDAVQVLPAFPRLRLWRNALEAAGASIEGLARVRDGLEKYIVAPPAVFDTTPTPLDALFILGEGPEPALLRLAPTAAFPAIQAHICRWRTANVLGRRQDLFAHTARIASSVPIYRLIRPKRFDALLSAVELVEGSCDP